jgi:adenine deaminase
MTNLEHVISVAKRQKPADILLKNGSIVNVFNGEIEKGSVAICGEIIAGIGNYQEGNEVIDLAGQFLVPGFINGHTHIESSMLDITQYARTVVPRGTLGIVTDLHEIANVTGKEGLSYILDSAKSLPIDLFLLAPSCVPATHLETSGAKLTTFDVEEILGWEGVIGLGEMMNFPGVINKDKHVLEKILAAEGSIRDGHAPSLSGTDLNAYIAAGITSDHESIKLAEAEEKLRRGMYIMIREGSSEKNLEDLLPLVNDKTYKRCLFVVDDRSCSDLLNDGDIDAVVRKAICLGLDPVRAIQLATINPAEYFRLNGLGALAPGYKANFSVLSDLNNIQVSTVFYLGKIVAENGSEIFNQIAQNDAEKFEHSVRIKTLEVEDLGLRLCGTEALVIEVIPGQIITRKKKAKILKENGKALSNPEVDILKLVVVERHRASGNIGLGFIRGFSLKKGALASTIAHDSHNIVAVGVDDQDIFIAIKELERLQGGLVVVANKTVLSSLSLPIAGLLSPDLPELVADKLNNIKHYAANLGCKLEDPFATLSFVALPVIPELRLTDLGLVDVNTFSLIDHQGKPI